MCEHMFLGDWFILLTVAISRTPIVQTHVLPHLVLGAMCSQRIWGTETGTVSGLWLLLNTSVSFIQLGQSNIQMSKGLDIAVDSGCY